MKTVAVIKDLELFGIQPLTGEADALSFRILCDLTPEGMAVVKTCFKLRGECFYPAYNHRAGAVASFMLPPDCVKPLAIIGFIGRDMPVIVTDKVVFGCEPNESLGLNDAQDGYELIRNGERYPWPDCYGTVKRIIFPTQQTLNTHAMSGRTL